MRDLATRISAVIWGAGCAVLAGIWGANSGWLAALFIGLAVIGWFAILGFPEE